MVAPTTSFIPLSLKGIRVHTDNPFRFHFILDTGNTPYDLQDDAALRAESERLIKYFLASLTIPEADLWVNLSPNEQDRIIPPLYGQTEMGKDMLAQDYLLKQMAASLIYPEEEPGKKFWERIYEKANERYGTINIPLDLFNKVWIVPGEAVVLENQLTAYVAESRLKVLTDHDYMTYNYVRNQSADTREVSPQTMSLATEVFREIVLPELEREVNEGEHFAALRQMYQALILATWYKQKLHASILRTDYIDQSKIDGVDIDDPEAKSKIYNLYMEAFKVGVFDYIKEEYDPALGMPIPRKYFSGGVRFTLNLTGLDGGRQVMRVIDITQEQTNYSLSPVGQYIYADSEALRSPPEAGGQTVPEETSAPFQGNLLQRGWGIRAVVTGFALLPTVMEAASRIGPEMSAEGIPVGSGMMAATAIGAFLAQGASSRATDEIIRRVEQAETKLADAIREALATQRITYDHRDVLAASRDLDRKFSDVISLVQDMLKAISDQSSVLYRSLLRYQDLIRIAQAEARAYFAVYLDSIWANDDMQSIDYQESHRAATAVWEAWNAVPEQERSKHPAWSSFGLAARRAARDAFEAYSREWWDAHYELKEQSRSTLQDYLKRTAEFELSRMLARFIVFNSLRQKPVQEVLAKAGISHYIAGDEDAQVWLGDIAYRVATQSNPLTEEQQEDIDEIVFEETRNEAGRVLRSLNWRRRLQVSAVGLGLVGLMSLSGDRFTAPPAAGGRSGENIAANVQPGDSQAGAGGVSSEEGAVQLTEADLAGLFADPDLAPLPDNAQAQTEAERSERIKEQEKALAAIREQIAAVEEQESTVTATLRQEEQVLRNQFDELSAIKNKPIPPERSLRQDIEDMPKEEEWLSPEKALEERSTDQPSESRLGLRDATSEDETPEPYEVSQGGENGFDRTLLASVEGDAEYLTLWSVDRFNPDNGKQYPKAPQYADKSHLLTGEGATVKIAMKSGGKDRLIAMVPDGHVIVDIRTKNAVKLTADEFDEVNRVWQLSFDGDPGLIRISTRPARPGELTTRPVQFELIDDAGTPLTTAQVGALMDRDLPPELAAFLKEARSYSLEDRKRVREAIMSSGLFFYSTIPELNQDRAGRSILKMIFEDFAAKCDGFQSVYAMISWILGLHDVSLESGFLVNDARVFEGSRHAWNESDGKIIESTAYAGEVSPLYEYEFEGGTVTEEDRKREYRYIKARAQIKRGLLLKLIDTIKLQVKRGALLTEKGAAEARLREALTGNSSADTALTAAQRARYLKGLRDNQTLLDRIAESRLDTVTVRQLMAYTEQNFSKDMPDVYARMVYRHRLFGILSILERKLGGEELLDEQGRPSGGIAVVDANGRLLDEQSAADLIGQIDRLKNWLFTILMGEVQSPSDLYAEPLPTPWSTWNKSPDGQTITVPAGPSGIETMRSIVMTGISAGTPTNSTSGLTVAPTENPVLSRLYIEANPADSTTKWVVDSMTGARTLISKDARIMDYTDGLFLLRDSQGYFFAGRKATGKWEKEAMHDRSTGIGMLLMQFPAASFHLVDAPFAGDDWLGYIRLDEDRIMFVGPATATEGIPQDIRLHRQKKHVVGNPDVLLDEPVAVINGEVIVRMSTQTELEKTVFYGKLAKRLGIEGETFVYRTMAEMPVELSDGKTVMVVPRYRNIEGTQVREFLGWEFIGDGVPAALKGQFFSRVDEDVRTAVFSKGRWARSVRYHDGTWGFVGNIQDADIESIRSNVPQTLSDELKRDGHDQLIQETPDGSLIAIELAGDPSTDPAHWRGTWAQNATVYYPEGTQTKAADVNLYRLTFPQFVPDDPSFWIAGVDGYKWISSSPDFLRNNPRLNTEPVLSVEIKGSEDGWIGVATTVSNQAIFFGSLVQGKKMAQGLYQGISFTGGYEAYGFIHKPYFNEDGTWWIFYNEGTELNPRIAFTGSWTSSEQVRRSLSPINTSRNLVDYKQPVISRTHSELFAMPWAIEVGGQKLWRYTGPAAEQAGLSGESNIFEDADVEQLPDGRLLFRFRRPGGAPETLVHNPPHLFLQRVTQLYDVTDPAARGFVAGVDQAWEIVHALFADPLLSADSLSAYYKEKAGIAGLPSGDPRLQAFTDQNKDRQSRLDAAQSLAGAAIRNMISETTTRNYDGQGMERIMKDVAPQFGLFWAMGASTEQMLEAFENYGLGHWIPEMALHARKYAQLNLDGQQRAEFMTKLRGIRTAEQWLRHFQAWDERVLMAGQSDAINGALWINTPFDVDPQTREVIRAVNAFLRTMAGAEEQADFERLDRYAEKKEEGREFLEVLNVAQRALTPADLGHVLKTLHEETGVDWPFDIELSAEAKAGGLYEMFAPLRSYSRQLPVTTKFDLSATQSRRDVWFAFNDKLNELSGGKMNGTRTIDPADLTRELANDALPWAGLIALLAVIAKLTADYKLKRDDNLFGISSSGVHRTSGEAAVQAILSSGGWSEGVGGTLSVRSVIERIMQAGRKLTTEDKVLLEQVRNGLNHRDSVKLDAILAIALDSPATEWNSIRERLVNALPWMPKDLAGRQKFNEAILALVGRLDRNEMNVGDFITGMQDLIEGAQNPAHREIPASQLTSEQRVSFGTLRAHILDTAGPSGVVGDNKEVVSTDHDGSLGRRTSQSGSSFAELRPYTPGDDLRNIAWGSSGGDRLMVKWKEEERQVFANFVIDLRSVSNATMEEWGEQLLASAKILYKKLRLNRNARQQDFALNEIFVITGDEQTGQAQVQTVTVRILKQDSYKDVLNKVLTAIEDLYEKEMANPTHEANILKRGPGFYREGEERQRNYVERMGLTEGFLQTGANQGNHLAAALAATEAGRLRRQNLYFIGLSEAQGRTILQGLHPSVRGYIPHGNRMATVSRAQIKPRASAPEVSAGRASVDDFTKGGIDFDGSKLNLKIEQTGPSVDLPVGNFEIHEGLYPVIYQLAPLESLPLWLGIHDRPSDPRLSRR